MPLYDNNRDREQQQRPQKRPRQQATMNETSSRTIIGTNQKQKSSVSVPSLLYRRSQGLSLSTSFWDGICYPKSRLPKTSAFQQPTLPILESLDQSITSLCLDLEQQRFMLAGSGAGNISIYDLSKWGLEHGTEAPDEQQERHRFKPVARTVRAPPATLAAPARDYTNNLLVGHSTAIRNAQWYGLDDTAAFCSGSTDGTILVWDTEALQPLLAVSPFQHEGGAQQQSRYPSSSLMRGRRERRQQQRILSVGSSHSPSLQCLQASAAQRNLVAVASPYVAAIHLVDLRSGASSHTLTGHVSGVNAVQWLARGKHASVSGSSPYLLASGGVDGTVRLWDIRKAGSQSCLAVLNHQASWTKNKRISRRLSSDFSHLRQQPQSRDQGGGGRKKKKARKQSPNDYGSVGMNESASLLASPSHEGPVTGLAVDNSGRFLVSSGLDGQLRLWDLYSSHGGSVQRTFVTTTGGPPVDGTSTSSTPLHIAYNGRNTNTLWVGRGPTVLGYDMEDHSGDDDMDGMNVKPRHVLKEHLGRIQSLETVEDTMQLFSGAKDGLILTWGPRSGSTSSSRARRTTTTGSSRQRLLQEDQDAW